MHVLSSRFGEGLLQVAGRPVKQAAPVRQQHAMNGQACDV